MFDRVTTIIVESTCPLQEKVVLQFLDFYCLKSLSDFSTINQSFPIIIKNGLYFFFFISFDREHHEVRTFLMAKEKSLVSAAS